MALLTAEITRKLYLICMPFYSLGLGTLKYHLESEQTKLRSAQKMSWNAKGRDRRRIREKGEERERGGSEEGIAIPIKRFAQVLLNS